MTANRLWTRRLRAGPRIADGGEPGDDRLTVDHEAAVAVENPGHGKHAGDRRAIEPVRVQWARPHDPGETVKIAQCFERRVAGVTGLCGAQYRTDAGELGEPVDDRTMRTQRRGHHIRFSSIESPVEQPWSEQP